MKRIGILTLFAFSVLVNAQEVTERLNLKQIDKRINRNEQFKSEVKEADAIAMSYLQAKREVYGLNSDFKIVKTAESPSGKYVYFQQYINDIPVYATHFIVYINKEDVVTYALNEFRDVSKYNITQIAALRDKNKTKYKLNKRIRYES